ncbi:MAG TPA: FAD-dependent monooxygenase [Burkholderiaceae bacterium]|nr:FAD-dependent monooxygenase [Burkholderiaceae bacterium]
MPRIGPFEHVEHAAAPPPLDGGRDPRRHRVAIAGGGPVGLATALALAEWGVPSVVVEADATVCTGSRAICVSRRSLEILGRLGALEGHLRKGLPWTGGRTYHGTTEILRFAMPHDAMQRLPPMINLQQYWIEHFLVEAAAARSDLIEIRWGSELVGVGQDEAGVSLEVACAGTRYAMRAARLVACDGGQSFVRRTLGLKLEGTAFEGKYVIADIVLPSAFPTERRAWFDPPSNPGSTVLMHRQPDDLWRIDYQVPDDADLDEALREENVAAFVRRHLAMLGEAELPWEIVWISAYRAGAMTLGRYRHGRIAFAGNAAHAMPIFGVRGLNSGFEDAFNLGWKLAAVELGLAGEALLDTYDAERLHAYRVNAAAAVKSTEFMAPPSRGFSLMREAAVTLAHAHPPIARLANPRQTTAIGYPDSPLNGAPAPGRDGPRPGDPLPEAPLRGPAGIAFASELGAACWTVIVVLPEDAAAPSPADDAALRALRAGRWPLRTAVIAARGEPGGEAERLFAVDDARVDGVEGTRHAARVWGATDGAVLLLRPDGHVAGRWPALDADAIGALLARAAA